MRYNLGNFYISASGPEGCPAELALSTAKHRSVHKKQPSGLVAMSVSVSKACAYYAASKRCDSYLC